jgi:acetyltransferase-like isoleucine patch superfamily enzyme
VDELGASRAPPTSQNILGGPHTVILTHLRGPARRLRAMLRQASSYWILRRAGVECVERANLLGKPHIRVHPGSTVVIRPGATLVSTLLGNQLEARGPCILQTTKRGAFLSIGEDAGLTSATVSASVRIEIGRRVLVGSGALITDSDHHPVDIDPVSARRGAGRPVGRPEDAVLISDDVFIGAHSIVLKGVRIGAGTVIGAGSVVVDSVPAGVVAAGNPCRVIRPLRGDA